MVWHVFYPHRAHAVVLCSSQRDHMEKQIKELRRMKRLLKEGRDSDVRGYHMPVVTRKASTHLGRARWLCCVSVCVVCAVTRCR